MCAIVLSEAQVAGLSLRQSVCRPLNKWGWKPLLWFNWFLIVGAFSTDTVMGVTFAVKKLVEDIHTFQWFATCYQCPKVPKGF